MRRRSCAVSLLALAGGLWQMLVAQAPHAATTSPDPRVTDTIVSLLEQSHDLGRQIPPGARLQPLTRQTELASRYRADLSREWANELFLISREVKGGPARSYAQSSAMAVLVRLDPNGALGLLDAADLEVLAPKGSGTPVLAQVVNEVFSAVIARGGASALPIVEQAAQRLGARGHYPYSALGYTTMEASAPFWRDDQPRAVEILRSVFEPAFVRYKKSARQDSDDFEFGGMLQVFAGGLPFDLVKPALHELVNRILAMDPNKNQFEAEVYTRDGRKVAVNTPIDATLTYFGQLVNRDPELVQELSAARPELQAGLEATREGNLRSMRFGQPFRTRAPHTPAGQNFQTEMDALALSNINADAAIAKAQQLPDDQRGKTSLDVARIMAGEHPQQAADLIDSVQRDMNSADPRVQLNVISAQVSVAAAQGNPEALRELLKRGFDLATQLTGPVQGNPPNHFTAGLPPMVQIGIQNEPAMTVAFLDGVPPSSEKADLLLGAAEALAMQVRLPIGSPQPSRVVQ
ncbi:MAG: hypothetical protein WBW33_30075 [Bryobacteraceae bacterium]